MELMDLIQQALDRPALDAMSAEASVPRDQLEAAIPPALAMLTTGLAKNTQSGGAPGLMGALDRDHDGGILDNLPGLIGAMTSQHGGGILGHLLGNRQGDAAQAVSKASGIDTGSAGKILAMLAPIIMAALSRKKQQDNLGAGELTDLLQSERSQAEAALPDGLSGITKMLDADGDGSVMDEITEVGGSLLGSFLKRR